MAKKRHHGDTKVNVMEESFRSGAGRDAMISSTDGLLPSGVSIKDYPSAGYTEKTRPYDGISGIDKQEDDDAAKLRRRSTKGSF